MTGCDKRIKGIPVNIAVQNYNSIALRASLHNSIRLAVVMEKETSDHVRFTAGVPRTYSVYTFINVPLLATRRRYNNDVTHAGFCNKRNSNCRLLSRVRTEQGRQMHLKLKMVHFTIQKRKHKFSLHALVGRTESGVIFVLHPQRG